MGHTKDSPQGTPRSRTCPRPASLQAGNGPGDTRGLGLAIPAQSWHLGTPLHAARPSATLENTPGRHRLIRAPDHENSGSHSCGEGHTSANCPVGWQLFQEDCVGQKQKRQEPDQACRAAEPGPGPRLAHTEGGLGATQGSPQPGRPRLRVYRTAPRQGRRAGAPSPSGTSKRSPGACRPLDLECSWKQALPWAPGEPRLSPRAWSRAAGAAPRSEAQADLGGEAALTEREPPAIFGS